MFRHALAFLAGTVCLPLVASRLPPPVWAVLVLVPLLAALALRQTLITVFCAGLLASWWQAQVQLDHRLPRSLEGRDLVVVGRIAGIPARGDITTRLRFDVERFDAPTGLVSPPRRLRLSLYRASIAPRAGERWRFRVRLKRPYGFHNPGGFDYEAWLFREGIHATGYVREVETAVRLAPAPALHVDALRQRLFERLRSQLEGVPGGGVILALALGIRQSVSPAQWDLLRLTGTSHLLAISGLHVGLLASLCYWVGLFLWSRSCWLSQRLAAPRAAALASMAAALVYAALAGFAVSTQRALIMVALVCGALVLGRRVRPLHTLSLALMVVLLFDPFAVLGAGFWLSFLAVCVLVLLAAHPEPRPGASGWPGRIYRLFALQLVLAMALLPLTVMHFHQAAWLSPLANLAAIPWVSLVLVPLVFIGLAVQAASPDWAQPLWSLAGQSYRLLEGGLGYLVTLPFAELRLARPLWITAPAALAVPLALTVRGLRRRLAAICLVVPLFLYRAPLPGVGEVWMDLLDVGQGLAVVIRTRHHALVYDTGPRFPSGLDTGRAVVLPFLESAGVSELDRLIISHGDNDHIGGARTLTDHLPVRQLLTSVPEQVDWSVSEACRAGQSWRWDGVAFAMLHPADPDWTRENNASCVLRVTAAAGTRVLLTGDIEAAAERRLLAHAGNDLAAEVLVAPHHGSRSSSTAAFIDDVDPDYILYPAGRRNRYGFPDPQVRARYREHGARGRMTGCRGSIAVRLDRQGGVAVGPGHRLRSRRLWHDAGCAGESTPARRDDADDA